MGGLDRGVHAAESLRAPAQVRVLLEDGSADFDARDVYSMDPLDEAMRHRHDEVAEYLRKSGALIGGHNPL